jgi:hypothetical protein
MDLTARQYHYGGREASPTHTGDLQSMLLALHQVLRHLRAVKDLIVNDTKTEHMSDLPYPNDLPQGVDRWVAKCIPRNLQFVNTLLLALHQVLRHLRAVKDLSHAQELSGNVRSSFKIT